MGDLKTEIDPGGAATSPGAGSSGGVNHAGLRAHNERLILSLLRRHGGLSKAEISRRTGLSAQTISVINRALEKDQLVKRGAPVRGKVGQPSIPMTLNRDGAFSIGLRIGRRSADLALMNFEGVVRLHIKRTYPYPTPDLILKFVDEELPTLTNAISPGARDRVLGIGIGAPSELWNWLDRLGAPSTEMIAWKDFDLVAAIEQRTGYDVMIDNDASCACLAEQSLGAGRNLSNFAYFFVGSFIGGGLALNRSVQTGVNGNAAAFGSIPSIPRETGGHHQLIDTASLYVLEAALHKAELNPSALWTQQADWDAFEPYVEQWLKNTAESIAMAIVAVCAVMDFPTIIIDGGFPTDVRTRLVKKINSAITDCNTQGIILPHIIEGAIGANARVIGASMMPISARFMVETSSFMSAD